MPPAVHDGSSSGVHCSHPCGFGSVPPTPCSLPLIPQCRGGHMFAPTKVWRRWHRKINVNQKRYAVASALAASAVPALVMARGHRIETVPEVPLVISDQAESINKTSKAVEVRSGLPDEGGAHAACEQQWHVGCEQEGLGAGPDSRHNILAPSYRCSRPSARCRTPPRRARARRCAPARARCVTGAKHWAPPFTRSTATRGALIAANFPRSANACLSKTHPLPTLLCAGATCCARARLWCLPATTASAARSATCPASRSPASTA